jgi:CubicO group peptidase (beta-lactamase class C family)
VGPQQIDEKTIRAEVDRIVGEAMTRRRIPSQVVGVINNNKVVLNKAYGRDPLYSFGGNEKGVPYALGAASQVLTGYAALVLVGQGRLSLADPVAKYLPSVPEKWRSITVGQFLAHMSGVPDLPKDAASLAAAMEEAGKAPLLFTPGTSWRNTYTDYDVVGEVIQTVAREPYLRFVGDSVFKPLKMNTSGDLSRLLFRYTAPTDVTVGGESNLTRSAFGGAAGSKSGRRADREAQQDMVRMVEAGVPQFSYPSRGLVANASDVLKLFSTLMSDSLPGIPKKVDYGTLAPGWKVCHAGDDVLMTATGMGSGGYGVILDLLPKRKAGLALLFKLEPGSDPTPPFDESESILQNALGLPTGSWDCSIAGSEVEE